MSEESPQIAAIKQRYKASFPEKVKIIREALTVVNSGGELHAVKEELHKLAGSSGMYGYSQLADSCRQAMQKVDDQSRHQLALELEKIIDLLEHGA